MKIDSLFENVTPSSSPNGLQSQQAPKFGRDPEVLEDENLEETTSGCVASVSQPIGGVQKRGKGSIFSGIKTSQKFPNSKTVKEGAYEDGVRDGIQGTPNRRASSIYGPESSQYTRGYEVGLQKGKEAQKARIAQAQQDQAPYEKMSDEELLQLRKDIQQRSNERQQIYQKLRGSSYGFDPKRHTPPNHAELQQQGKEDNKAWNIINQVLWQRGVNIDESKEADYGDEYQSMVKRVGQRAKEGERKVAYNPATRKYKTVPVNEPKKDVEEELSRRDLLKRAGGIAAGLAAGGALAKGGGGGGHGGGGGAHGSSGAHASGGKGGGAGGKGGSAGAHGAAEPAHSMFMPGRPYAIATGHGGSTHTMNDADKQEYIKFLTSYADAIRQGRMTPQMRKWLEAHPEVIEDLKRGPAGLTMGQLNADLVDIENRRNHHLMAKNEAVNEVSDETLMSYLTKVDADARKHNADPTKRSPQKANKSVSGFSRAFNKLDARKGVAEETIHVGYRNSSGDWIKTTTHDNYRDAKAAMERLVKAGKKGVQHRYDHKGNIDPGAMMTARPDSGVAEGSDPVWNKGTPMPKDYTCHCGIHVHPSVRKPGAIHTPDCPYAKQQGVAEGSLNEFAPADDGDNRTQEYEVYQCNPDDQFDWIGGPIYKTDDMGKAHNIAYNLHKKYPNKAFMIWQERSQGSRGGYGIKEEQGVAEDSDPCWDNYKQIGMKTKNGKQVPNCVPKEGVEVEEDWQKVNKSDKTDGMSPKAVKAYRRENPGSKLKTAVTTKPSKLKKGSKAAKRRKSFCARMSGMKKAHASAKTKRDPDSPINKALRRWNCESIEELQELMMIAEQEVKQLSEAANPAQQAAIAIAKKKKSQGVDEEKQRLDPSCWKGYKKQGTKMKGGVRVNNCVPAESVNEAELSEEQLLAKDLLKQLEIFKKAKDKDLSGKPSDREIQKKIKEDGDASLPGAVPGIKIMSPEQFAGQEVDEATKLPAQSREMGDQEFQDYMTRIVGSPDIDKKTGKPKVDKKGIEKYVSGKTKTDKYKMPYIHRSSAIEYYDESGKRFKEEAIINALKQRPKSLLKQNEKMKHSNGELEQFFNVGFAALTGVAVDESTGKLIIVNTCPGAGSCKVDCFAMKGGKVQFKAAWLSDGRILTYLLNDPEGFFNQLSSEISKEEKAGQKGGYNVTIRWHDAGDFFSPEYLDMALKMAAKHPNVKFYAYTKMAGAALAQKPNNFIINWSEGANTSQEKQVKANDPSLDTTKNSRIVPEKLFYDLLAKDAKGNLAKGPDGQWQVASTEALAELKQRLAQAYKISPSSILSYNEYMAKRKSIPQGMKYNVIVAPGEGDISANDQNVLSTLLLRH